MHILWASNYQSHSGYANQSRLFIPRIRAAGHTVTVADLGGGVYIAHRDEDGVMLIPPRHDPWFADSIESHFAACGADCVISLCDTWGMNGPVYAKLPWYPFTPVDHLPAPPQVVDTVKLSKRPIAYSVWGTERLKEAGLEPLFWPHAFDPKVFYPEDRETARKALGVAPDVFFVSFVGVNDSVPNRKGMPELLEAWQKFANAHPDALLYLHTTAQGNLPVNPTGGVNLGLIMKTLDIDRSRVLMPDEYLYYTGMPQEHLRHVYSASDVFVLPTRGEGFGLPLLEAQACSCPVVTTEVGAQRDLCAPDNRIEGWLDWSFQSAYQVKADPMSILDQLERHYAMRGTEEAAEQRESAFRFASAFEADRIFQHYGRNALQQIADEVV